MRYLTIDLMERIMEGEKIEKTRNQWLDLGRLVKPGSRCNRRPSSPYHPEQKYEYYDISDTLDFTIDENYIHDVINCFDENVIVVAAYKTEKKQYIISFKKLSDEESIQIEIDDNPSDQRDFVLKLLRNIKLIIIPFRLSEVVFCLQKLNVEFLDLIYDEKSKKQKILVYEKKNQLSVKYSENEEYKKLKTEKEKIEYCIRIIVEEFKRLRLRYFLKDRGIEYLVHFTRLENVESIKKNGILSLATARKKCVDIEQHDGSNPTHVYLSIEFPNYKMFYKLSIGSQDKWVVILLKAYEILSRLKCSFSTDNSARHDIKSGNEYEVLDNGTYLHLVSLFGENNRSKLCKKNWTTNPQAEVIVDDYIPPEYIVKFIKKDEDNSYFSCRGDYQKPQ